MVYDGPKVKRLYWSAWALLGLFIATQDIIRVKTALTVKLIVILLLLNLAQTLVWGVMSLSTLYIVRRYPLHGTAPLRHWWTHLAAGIAITATGVALSGSLAFLIDPPRESLVTALQQFMFSYFPFDFLVCYWGVVGIHEGIQILKDTRERELRVSMLETKVAQAQFRSMQAQLNPNFLFNTLNAVSGLMRSEPATADRMLVKLSHLLRLSLEQSREEETSLARELEFLEGYLEVERMRLGDRLRVVFDVPDDLLDAQVPAFVLQPLLGNAIQYGTLDPREGGTIHIRARQEEGMLTMEVQDDGQPQAPPRQTQRPESDPADTQGTRSRLAEIYGTNHGFDLQFPEGGGTLARIRLPLCLVGRSPRFVGAVIPA